MYARLDKPIYHRQLQIDASRAKYRSFYIPFDDRYEIYYAGGLGRNDLRYYKSKELLQIHLWQESLRTTDIVDLVQNMILRESPSSTDLNLGHPATSDTLGEIAAMEFLFPVSARMTYLQQSRQDQNGIVALSNKYAMPHLLSKEH